jgi:uncharacterized protein (DUF1499 family)
MGDSASVLNFPSASSRGLTALEDGRFLLTRITKLRYGRRNRRALPRKASRGAPPMRRFFRYPAIFVSVIVVAGAALLMTTLGERPLSLLFPVGDVGMVDFAELKLTDKPNQFLMCPVDFCGADPNAVSPVFEVTAERLRARWREVLADQPRIETLSEYADGSQVDYVQRSARFRFPDIITVRVIAVSASQSTLAIYSRSIYGQDDFGVNRERVEAWLALLREGQ